jgi:capsular exopolysaccharide synthesis family protein
MLPPDPNQFGPHKAASDPAPSVNGTGHDEAPRPLPGPSAPPPALSAPPSLSTLAQAFRRCWSVAVPVALLGALAAVAVAWLVVPGQYVTHAILRVPVEPEGTHILDHQRSHTAFVKSAAVLDKVLAEPGVAGTCAHRYTVPGLQQAMLVDFDAGRYLMRVTLSGERAEDVAALLNALGHVYPRELKAQEALRNAPRLKELKDRRAEVQKALDEKRAEYDDPRIRRKLAARDDRGAAVASAEGKLVAEETRLNARRIERTELKAQLDAKEAMARSPVLAVVTPEEVNAVVFNDEGYKGALDKLRRAEAAFFFYRDKAAGPAKEAGMEAQRREMAAARRLIDEMREGERKRLEKEKSARSQAEAARAVKELSLKLQQVELALKQAEHFVADARVERDVAKAAAAHLDADVRALDDDLERLKRRRDSLDGEVDRVEQAVRANQAFLHADVVAPRERKLDRKIKIASATGLSAFGLLLLGGCLLESRSRRVYGASDVSLGLGLPVLGTLPAVPAAARAVPLAGVGPGAAPSPAALAALGALTESVDALRIMLLHAPHSDASRVLMVTSAVGGEGKTTVASHLAASLARAWRKTLLIDGDLRSPGAHAPFGQPAAPGLCELLRGEVELEDVLRPTSVSRLWLLPAGALDNHALQALAQDSVAGLFERLKEEFDFVVLDTSPVLPVPDALLLGQHADAVLLAVLRDVSRAPAVYAAQQRLQALGICPLGAVVLGEKAEPYGRRFPYPRPSANGA